MQNDPSSTPRVAIITGASRGVGRATAQALDADGYATVLVGRTQAALQETADSLTRPALVRVADITDPAACQQIVDQAVQRFGRVDVLANVAGWVELAPIAQITPESWRRTIDTNLSAIVYLTTAAWPVFQQQGGGFVVNVSSMASRDPFPGLGAYAAAKVGVNMFTQVTASEGEAIGVQAVCIVPGAVETAMLRSLFTEQQLPADQTLPPAEVAALIADCVAGRRRVDSGSAVTITP